MVAVVCMIPSSETVSTSGKVWRRVRAVSSSLAEIQFRTVSVVINAAVQGVELTSKAVEDIIILVHNVNSSFGPIDELMDQARP